MLDPSALTLAIESSCDETAFAIVDGYGTVHFEQLFSQIEIHRQYGGVVPEVASRSHFDAVQVLLDTLRPEIDRLRPKEVAATLGPGLIGPLLVGANLGRGLAMGWGVPFRGIHHLRGHIASAVLSPAGQQTLRDRAAEIFPAWVALVSGGHSQILSVENGLHCKKLWDTADDAAGECLDKCAKLLGFDYPGGPALEKAAASLSPPDRDGAKILSSRLPRPKSEAGYSFSGLKTAFRLLVEKEREQFSAGQFAFAIQEAVFESLLAGLNSAIKKADRWNRPKKLVFCGGVAANQTLRMKLAEFTKNHGIELHLPPLKYSTDNAVMIAAAAWIQDPELDLQSCEGRIPLAGSL